MWLFRYASRDEKELNANARLKVISDSPRVPRDDDEEAMIASAQDCQTFKFPSELNENFSKTTDNHSTESDDSMHASCRQLGRKRGIIYFRKIKPSDRDLIQRLHEQWFPVEYTSEFFDGLCCEKTINGTSEPLYCCVACFKGLDDDVFESLKRKQTKDTIVENRFPFLTGRKRQPNSFVQFHDYGECLLWESGDCYSKHGNNRNFQIPSQKSPQSISAPFYSSHHNPKRSKGGNEDESIIKVRSHVEHEKMIRFYSNGFRFDDGINLNNIMSQKNSEETLDEDTDFSESGEHLQIVGCLVGTFLNSSSPSKQSSSVDGRNETAALLIPDPDRHPRMFYIMTLGITREFRRSGLGSILVNRVVDMIELQPECGALYLHVIVYNKGAMKLYERLGFSKVKSIEDYYTINSVNFDCFLFARYFHGNRGHRNTVYDMVYDFAASLVNIMGRKKIEGELLSKISYFEFRFSTSWKAGLIRFFLFDKIFVVIEAMDELGKKNEACNSEREAQTDSDVIARITQALEQISLEKSILDGDHNITSLPDYTKVRKARNMSINSVGIGSYSVASSRCHSSNKQSGLNYQADFKKSTRLIELPFFKDSLQKSSERKPTCSRGDFQPDRPADNLRIQHPVMPKSKRIQCARENGQKYRSSSLKPIKSTQQTRTFVRLKAPHNIEKLSLKSDHTTQNSILQQESVVNCSSCHQKEHNKSSYKVINVSNHVVSSETDWQRQQPHHSKSFDKKNQLIEPQKSSILRNPLTSAAYRSLKVNEHIPVDDISGENLDYLDVPNYNDGSLLMVTNQEFARENASTTNFNEGIVVPSPSKTDILNYSHIADKAMPIFFLPSDRAADRSKANGLPADKCAGEILSTEMKSTVISENHTCISDKTVDEERQTRRESTILDPHIRCDSTTHHDNHKSCEPPSINSVVDSNERAGESTIATKELIIASDIQVQNPMCAMDSDLQNCREGLTVNHSTYYETKTTHDYETQLNELYCELQSIRVLLENQPLQSNLGNVPRSVVTAGATAFSNSPRTVCSTSTIKSGLNPSPTNKSHPFGGIANRSCSSYSPNASLASDNDSDFMKVGRQCVGRQSPHLLHPRKPTIMKKKNYLNRE